MTSLTCSIPVNIMNDAMIMAIAKKAPKLKKYSKPELKIHNYLKIIYLFLKNLQN
jgi:hypothetical protein